MSAYSRIFASLVVLAFIGLPLLRVLVEPPVSVVDWVFIALCWIAAPIIAYYDVYKGGAKP